MKVGIPREVKNHEYRVAITPAGVHELVRSGHEVFVEKDAGVGSSHRRRGLRRRRRDDPADRRRRVGRPATCAQGQGADRARSTTGCARARCCSPTCTWPRPGPAPTRCSTSGITAIAYETVQLPDGSLPLLAPMSEVAGRMAPQVGAHHLQRDGGGRGVLMGGVSGVYAAKVVVLGAGVSGHERRGDRARHAGRGAAARQERRQAAQADAIYQGHCQTVASNAYEVERAVIDADLVIGAVLVPGAKAPTLVTNELVSRMKPGSVLVDISIDQGGCFEDSRPTTHADPTYEVHDSRLLLRREHARRGAAHLDLRADQRDPAVRAGDRRTGAGATRCARTRRWRSG